MGYCFDKKNIVEFEREDKVLFFNPLKPSWMVGNANSRLVLELCDGIRSHADIVNSFCSLYGGEFREAVDLFLHHAASTGILSCEESPRPAPQRLSLVQLSISKSCNLSCVYCYATDREEHGRSKMHLEDYRRVIDGICRINPDVSFTLTGGEPLLNRECLDIASYIRDKGCAVDLLTNGTLISEKNIDEISRLFYRVTISSDGSTDELFDSFRGCGVHSRVQRAIRLLESRNVDYGVSMVVNRRNICDVENMARKYGGRLNYQPLFDAGTAKTNDGLAISGAEYYAALSKAHGVSPLSYCEFSLDAARECKNCKCAIGDGEISISESGDVYPCQLLHYPQFLAGNIFDASIEEIYANSPILIECRRLDVDHIEGCDGCFLRYVCGGACRARAFHECGSLTVAGSFCEYEKQAFIDGIFKLYSHNLMLNH